MHERHELLAGPGTFARVLAARQMAWWIRQLDYNSLASVIGLAIPCILAAVDDASPAVQCMGLWALHHLATGILKLDLAFAAHVPGGKGSPRAACAILCAWQVSREAAFHGLSLQAQMD